MTLRDSIEAVMQALQRQQSEATARDPIPAEPIIEVGPADDSLIKARYASTILRVARTSDRETAARLVRGLAGDLPLQSEHPEIADMHIRAIDSFYQLATSLRDNEQRPPWKTAVDAAADWLRAVETLGNDQ
jgi:hypothetical protein